MMTPDQLAAYMAEFERGPEWAKARAAARYSLQSLAALAECMTAEELAHKREGV